MAGVLVYGRLVVSLDEWKVSVTKLGGEPVGTSFCLSSLLRPIDPK